MSQGISTGLHALSVRVCVMVQVPECTRGQAWSVCVNARVCLCACVCEPTSEQVYKTRVNVCEHMCVYEHV